MNNEQFKKAEEIDRKIDSIKHQLDVINKTNGRDESIFCVQHVNIIILEKCQGLIVDDLKGQLAELELEFKNL